MKKHIAVFLLFALLFSLASCGLRETGTIPVPDGTPSALAETYPELCTKSVKDLLDDPNYGLELLQQVVVQTALAYYYQNPNTQYNMKTAAIVIGSRAGGFFRMITWPPEMAGEDVRYYNQCSGYVYDVYYNALNTAADGSGDAFQTYGGPGFWTEAGGKSDGYMSKIDDPNTCILVYDNDRANVGELEEALRALPEVLQPADIIVTSGHIMIYLGDCFGDGKSYVGHCWPFHGGSVDGETFAQAFEPYGAIVIETMDALFFGGRNPQGYPTLKLGEGNHSNFAVIRPLVNAKMADYYVTSAAATRFARPHMGLRKSADKDVFQSVLPNSDVTVTETIENNGTVDYNDISLVETIPDGTKFVRCSDGGTEKGGVLRWTLNVPAGEKVSVTYTFNVGKKNIGDEIIVPSGYLDSLPTRTFVLKVGYDSMSEANQAKLTEAAKSAESAFKGVGFANEFYRDTFGVELNLPESVTELATLVTEPQRVKGVDLMIVREKDEQNAFLFDMATPRHLIGQRVIYDLDDLLHDNLLRQLELRENYCEPGDVFISFGGTLDYLEDVEIDIVLPDYTVLQHTQNGTEIKEFKDSVGLLLRQSFVITLRPSRTFESLSQ